jgi:hypothetical protein
MKIQNTASNRLKFLYTNLCQKSMYLIRLTGFLLRLYLNALRVGGS